MLLRGHPIVKYQDTYVGPICPLPFLFSLKKTKDRRGSEPLVTGS
jgi:hypothetical protein